MKGGTSLPAALVIGGLRELLKLPGATACQAGKPLDLSVEYCVAFYRTQDDWRVSHPIRNLWGEQTACMPPYGGVDDEMYRQNTYTVGFAHNHTCNDPPSSRDLSAFPSALIEGSWEAVQFATDVEGSVILINGEPIPVAGWMIRPDGRILRWNTDGKVDEWNEEQRKWRHVSTCAPLEPSMLMKQQRPRCEPPLR